MSNDYMVSQNSISGFFTKHGSDARCPTCAKEAMPCLVWNCGEQIYEYRPRRMREGERFAITHHSEIGDIRVITRYATLHGTPHEILAEPIVCAGGVLLITGWSSRSIRSYGNLLPGRIRGGRRESRGRQRNRRSPIPLRFHTLRLYDWLLRVIEPIPATSDEFVRLLAIFSRLLKDGHSYRDVLSEYADELARYIDLPEDEGFPAA